MMLFHGTCASLLERIRRYGITPRRSRPSVWPNCASKPEHVYLTMNYGVHFAKAAATGEDGLLLGVSYAALDPSRLYADEDAVRQAYGKPLKNISLGRYKRLGATARWSLDALGNCSHRGTIRPERGWIIKDIKQIPWLAFSDPSVSLMNHAICGAGHSARLRWIAQGCEGPMPELISGLSVPVELEDFIRDHVEEVDVTPTRGKSR
jgi:hypothetical protein